ncbi:MAG: hypothetical protein WEB03_09650 [Nitriliruptor sp.]|uniref:hypothetical protein n=1 Tax=Nitriliruptor sp. TaxID=2448056 RepID=UPI0034A095CA
MIRPEVRELDAAHRLLSRLADERGLSNLRHGDGAGEVVADVEQGRTYFDIVAFEDDVEGRLGWRPEVVDAEAPGARPGRAVGTGQSHAA